MSNCSQRCSETRAVHKPFHFHIADIFISKLHIFIKISDQRYLTHIVGRTSGCSSNTILLEFLDKKRANTGISHHSLGVHPFQCPYCRVLTVSICLEYILMWSSPYCVPQRCLICCDSSFVY